MSTLTIKQEDFDAESSISKHEMVFIAREKTKEPKKKKEDEDCIRTKSCSRKKIVVRQGAQGAVGPTGPAGRSIQGEKGDTGNPGGIGPTGPPGESINDSSIYLLMVLSTSFPNSFSANSSSSIISMVPIVETNSNKSIGNVVITVSNASKTFTFVPTNNSGYSIKLLRVTSLNFTGTGVSSASLTFNSAAVLNQVFYLSIVWNNS